jgi:holo-[acyl-carrier protein] synthase
MTALAEVRDRLAALAALPGVGVDAEDISRWADPDLRLFTPAEQAHCVAAGSGRARAERFAGRWCAKEAVVKAVAAFTGPVVPTLRDVEVVPDAAGRPLVQLSDRLAAAALDVAVSITHTPSMAIAVAVARPRG